MSPLLQRILASVIGAAAAAGDGPWRAKTVRLALVILLVGLGLWVRDAAKGPPPAPTRRAPALAAQPASAGGWDFTQPVPAYARLSASYIGGFFIGWAFRRFLRLALSLAALGLLLVGLAKYSRCNVAPAETTVKDSAARFQHEVAAAREHLKGLLPSASAAAVGLFLGFRRKGRRPHPLPDQPLAP